MAGPPPSSRRSPEQAPGLSHDLAAARRGGRRHAPGLGSAFADLLVHCGDQAEPGDLLSAVPGPRRGSIGAARRLRGVQDDCGAVWLSVAGADAPLRVHTPGSPRPSYAVARCSLGARRSRGRRRSRNPKAATTGDTGSFYKNKDTRSSSIHRGADSDRSRRIARRRLRVRHMCRAQSLLSMFMAWRDAVSLSLGAAHDFRSGKIRRLRRAWSSSATSGAHASVGSSLYSPRVPRSPAQGSSSVSASGRRGSSLDSTPAASFAGATALATRSSAAWGCCWASFEAVTTTASTAASSKPPDRRRRFARLRRAARRPARARASKGLALRPSRPC